MGFFDKAFKPKEVKATLLALDLEEDKCASNVAFEIVKKGISERVCVSENTVASIKEDGLLPSTLIYILMTNVISAHLGSGRYHTYRGILSFNGKELLKLWDYAVDGLYQAGYYNDAKANEDRQWIRGEIKKIG